MKTPLITKEQYLSAQKLIKDYELQELQLRKETLSKTATTSIPESNWGVHESHCCFEHGCKYGYEDCPVTLGLTQQDYRCEDCD